MKKYISGILLMCIGIAALLLMYTIRSKPIETLLHPPGQSRELAQFWLAFEKNVGKDFILKTPAIGENRSALIRYDLDGSGKEETVVFYCKNKSSDKICMQVLSHKGGNWNTVSVIDTGYNELRQVEFADVNGDGVDEIIIGWGIRQNNIIQKVSVFKVDLENKKLENIFEESYLAFNVYDLNFDSSSEIVIFKNNEHKPMKQKAMVYGYKKGKIACNAVCFVDASIATISQVHFDSLNTSKISRVYIDGYTADGLMSTDLLIYNVAKGEFVDSSISGKSVSALSKRSTNIYCSDINLDGIVEIPFQNATNNESGNIHIIEWMRVNQGTLKRVSCYIDNREQHYYFKLPSILEDVSTPALMNNGRVLRLYSTENGNSDSKSENIILEIVVKNDEQRDYTDVSYKYIANYKGMSYYYKILSEGYKYNLNKRLISQSIIFE